MSGYCRAQPGKLNIWPYLPDIALAKDERVTGFLKMLPENAVVLDVGSGKRLWAPDIITMDRFLSENTKTIGDIHKLPFKDECLDGIICTAVLEHIQNPWLAAREFHRVMKPGGRLFAAVPFMQGYHPDPSDYWRFTEDGLIALFEGFKRLDGGCSLGSASGLSWALVDFFRSFSDNKYMSEILGIIMRILFFWVKYLDLLLEGKKNNRYFASGVFFIGEKK